VGRVHGSGPLRKEKILDFCLNFSKAHRKEIKLGEMVISLQKNMEIFQEVDWIIWSNFYVDHLD
jgi:hypothetical protein